MLVEQVHNSGSRAVWSRPPQRSASGACPPRRAARASARVQALQGDAEELRRVPRGSAAAPLRVYSPVAEAAAAPTAAPPSDDDASCRCLPGLGHAPVTMEHVSAPVVEDMAICRQNLLNVVGERHPMLLAAANQIFSAGGKRLRPLICLLVARATYPLTGLRCAFQGGRAKVAWSGDDCSGASPRSVRRHAPVASVCATTCAAASCSPHSCLTSLLPPPPLLQRHHRAAPSAGRD